LAEAKLAKSAEERHKTITQAQQEYSKSLEYWRRIPNASRISPNVFRVGSEGDVAIRLAECRSLSDTK